MILDESTQSGGVGASIRIGRRELFDELDALVKRLCMDDACLGLIGGAGRVKRGSACDCREEPSTVGVRRRAK